MLNSPGSGASVLSLSPELGRNDLLEFLDYPPGRGPPRRMEPLVAEALETGGELAEPRGAFLALEPEAAHAVLLPPLDASLLVLGMVTIGSALERRVAELSRRGRLTAALMLDAVGSAAAERTADALCARVVGQPAAVGPITCRLSPGYGEWPIEAQGPLFSLLPVRELGMSLSTGFMMSPRKSISFAMWLGADGESLPTRMGCRFCSLPRCRYRRP